MIDLLCRSAPQSALPKCEGHPRIRGYWTLGMPQPPAQCWTSLWGNWDGGRMKCCWRVHVCVNMYTYIYTCTHVKKKKSMTLWRDIKKCDCFLWNFPLRLCQLYRGNSQVNLRQKNQVSFWLSGVYFTSSPRGNLEHFLTIQVCKWEVLQVRYISLLLWLQLTYRIIFSMMVFSPWSLLLSK